jgi:hypothetical protein
MGVEYGVMPVDITFGHRPFGSDELGLSKAGTAGLIILGPIGLIAILTGLVKTGSSEAPPQPGETDDMSPEGEEGAPEEGSTPDDGSAPDDGSYASDESGRVARARAHATPEMKAASADPAYKRAAHKLFIENVPFAKLSPTEQRAFNRWRRSIGRSDLS